MKNFSHKNHLKARIFVALSLTGILAVGGTLSLLQTATAEAFNRQDRTAQQIKQRRPTGKLPQVVADAILKAAGQRTGLPPKQFRIVKSEPIQTNGCLNLPKPAEACTKINMQAWEVTVEAKQQRLVYRSDTRGSQVRLNEAASYIIESNLPKSVEKAVLQEASKTWGLPEKSFKIIKAVKVSWAYGCEVSTFPYPCDPIATDGWQLTLQNGQKRWVYNTDETGSLVRLSKRELLTVNAKAPSQVVDAALKLASQHLSLPTSELLVVEIKQETWPDACLGLPSPVERCMGTATPGWRVIVEGKPKEIQVYRTNNDGSQIRTEAIAGMPPRNDEAPNTIAYAALREAGKRLNAPTSELRILQAQRMMWTDSCFGLPSPADGCAIGNFVGWRVMIDGRGQSVVYRTNEDGSQIRLEDPATVLDGNSRSY